MNVNVCRQLLVINAKHLIDTKYQSVSVGDGILNKILVQTLAATGGGLWAGAYHAG